MYDLIKCTECYNDLTLINITWKSDTQKNKIDINQFVVTGETLEVVHKKAIYKYLDDEITKEILSDLNFNGQYFMNYYCSNCLKEIEIINESRNFWHFIKTLDKIFLEEYNKIFFETYNSHFESLMYELNPDDKIRAINILFDRNNENTIRIFRIHDIWFLLPWERGAGIDFAYIFSSAAFNLVMNIVSNFIYNVNKKHIKKSYKKVKKYFKHKLIKFSISKSFIRNKNLKKIVKEEEKKCKNYINEHAMDLIKKYLNENES